MGFSNSAAPSQKALDLFKVGSDWTLLLYASDGTTQVVSTTIGTVEVGASSEVTLPLDLRALGGSAAHSLRIFGAGVIKVVHAHQFNTSFPVAALTVVDGEVIPEQIEKIVDISGSTRVRISWG